MSCPYVCVFIHTSVFLSLYQVVIYDRHMFIVQGMGYIIFISTSLTFWTNKLECLFLASLLSIVHRRKPLLKLKAQYG